MRERYVFRIIDLIEEKTPQLKKLDHWWPSYFNEPEKILPSLLVRFQELREKFPQPKPIFLDCCCGDGILIVLAGCAVFESFGIEIDEKLASLAQEINYQAFQKGLVLNEGKIAVGSYYIPQLVTELKGKAIKELQRLFSEYGHLETDSFEDYEDLLLESQNKRSLSYVLGEIGPKPYDQLELLEETPKGLFLRADLVFCYHSDLFFNSLFFYQFGRIFTRPNFLLATFAINENESSENRGDFYRKYSLPIFSPSFPKMRIDVFSKRKF